MKRVAIARDLIPITDFRAHLAECISRVEKTGRPLVLTQQGRAAAVLVSPESLDEMEERTELAKKVLRGLKQIAAGRVVEDEVVWGDVEKVIASAEKGRARKVE